MTIVDPATIPAVGSTLDCGHVRSAMPTPGGTGYARTHDDRTLCYPCADASERDRLRELGAMDGAPMFSGYVDSAGNLTTWSGGLLARGIPHTHGVSRSGWNGSKVHSWRFRADDGSEWYGRNAGHGMRINVRRALHTTVR